MNERTQFPLKIIFRPLLVQAMFAFQDNTTLFTSQMVFLINSKDSPEEQNVSLWHEALHMLLRAGGKMPPHDEKWVEARAKALAQACPDLLEKMK
jgi:hypothetical protein